MLTGNAVSKLSDEVFGEDTNTFAVLDGASVRGLRQKLFAMVPQNICLYRGELEPDIAEVAPYVVKLDSGTEFSNWVITSGWGKHWGIFVQGYDDIRQMRAHFRSLLTVFDDAGRPLRFRYYDPRVLRLYLPTCNAEELRTVFGPLVSYLMEDEDPGTLIKFELANGLLRRKKIGLQ